MDSGCVFTNFDATEQVGYGTPVLCAPPWNGGQRDVWFTLTTPATPNPIDLTITVLGCDNGNGPITNPQIAIYRGDCTGFAELICASATLGEQILVLDVFGLDALENYWIRINDYSATGTPEWGDFTLRVDEFELPPCLADGNTTACSGTLFDSGCDTGDYGNNEDLVYTICPSDPHNCIFFDISVYDFENNFDVLTIYDGPDINSPISAIVTGSGTNFQAQAASGCMTIQFTSDGTVTAAGFEATWSCSFIECDNAPPPPPDFSACTGTFFDTGERLPI